MQVAGIRTLATRAPTETWPPSPPSTRSVTALTEHARGMPSYVGHDAASPRRLHSCACRRRAPMRPPLSSGRAGTISP
jgi:hypothetical protein